MLSWPEAIQQDKYKTRAQRFPIEAPVRYRAGGDVAWGEGATVNISRSGVLFRAEKEIEPKTMLEMRIVFPSEITGNGPANILCWGRSSAKNASTLRAPPQRLPPQSSSTVSSTRSRWHLVPYPMRPVGYGHFCPARLVFRLLFIKSN